MALEVASGNTGTRDCCSEEGGQHFRRVGWGDVGAVGFNGG